MLVQFLFTILVFSIALSYEQACNYEDQSSLLAFSANISTSPPLNWSSSISCCHWEGVDCDASGRVTHLQLPSRGLEGIITSSINSLIKLKVIDLSSNSIHGFIPPSLMNCSKLEEILLRVNLLNGDFSELDFSRLVHLQKLDLANNALEGPIPQSLYSCKSLVAFRVSVNNISGQISPRIVGLKSLSFLSMTHNSLTNITSALRVLAKCKNLTVLVLSASFYREILPVHRTFIGLHDFPKLQVLAVGNNDFGGPIPDWLSNLKRLRYLDLSGNGMTGKVPDWLGTLPNLIYLSLSDNSLSGEVPLQLFLLPSLISRDPNGNHFHCDLPLQLTIRREIIWSGHALHITATLKLSNNRFSGNIPPEIGSLQGLQGINFSSNNFSGPIPGSISNLKYLESLELYENSLTGEIPTSLQSLSFLSTFNVSYNKLEGPIPTGGQLETFDESSFMDNPRLCGEQINRSCSNNAPSPSNVIDGYVTRDHWMQDFVNGLITGCSFGFSSVLAIVASCVWFNGSRPHTRRAF